MFPVNKEFLRQKIIDQLQRELDTALSASQQAHESATHEESQAENKYDTRGLEAAYLAHGLSVRSAELQQAIVSWRQLPLDSDEESTSAHLGSLVMLEDDDGEERRLLIGPCSGGLKLDQPDIGTITVVTPSSPLGRKLLGSQPDDEVTLSVAGIDSRYAVVAIC